MCPPWRPCPWEPPNLRAKHVAKGRCPSGRRRFGAGDWVGGEVSWGVAGSQEPRQRGFDRLRTTGLLPAPRGHAVVWAPGLRPGTAETNRFQGRSRCFFVALGCWRKADWAVRAAKARCRSWRCCSRVMRLPCGARGRLTDPGALGAPASWCATPGRSRARACRAPRPTPPGCSSLRPRREFGSVHRIAFPSP